MIEKYLEIKNKKDKLLLIESKTEDSIKVIKDISLLRWLMLFSITVCSSALFFIKQSPSYIIDTLNTEVARLHEERDAIIQKLFKNDSIPSGVELNFDDKYNLYFLKPDDNYFSIFNIVEKTSVGHDYFFNINFAIYFCLLIIGCGLICYLFCTNFLNNVNYNEKINFLSVGLISFVPLLVLFLFFTIFLNGYPMFQSILPISVFFVISSVLFLVSQYVLKNEHQFLKMVLKDNQLNKKDLKNIKGNIAKLSNEFNALTQQIISDPKCMNLLYKEMKKDLTVDNFNSLNDLFKLYEHKQKELKRRNEIINDVQKKLKENKHIEIPKINNI